MNKRESRNVTATLKHVPTEDNAEFREVSLLYQSSSEAM